jgi:hypothetical protein
MNRLLFFIVILILVYFGCLSYDTFTNVGNNKKEIHDITIKNEKHFMVAFSQLNNKVKDKLIKNNLDIFTSIFGNQFAAVVKFIKKDTDLIPVNDPVLIIKYDTLKLLTDKSAHIVLNKNGTPFYNDEGKNININRKLIVKDDMILLVSDKTDTKTSIDFQLSKINDKFIHVKKLDLDDNIIFLAKTGNENRNINWN